MAEDMLPERLPMLGLEGITLKAGGHRRRESGVCAMEALAWVAGEPHSDKPACACPVIAAFIRDWNDALPDDETRTRLLRPLLPILLNTRATPDVEMVRSRMAIDWLAREYAPAWLSLTDSLKAHAVALRGLSPLDSEERCAQAQPALSAAYSAALSAADSAADSAARSAAYSAAYSAARSAADSAARSAARSAADSALAPTVAMLQIGAADLVRRMAAVTEAR